VPRVSLHYRHVRLSLTKTDAANFSAVVTLAEELPASGWKTVRSALARLSCDKLHTFCLASLPLRLRFKSWKV